MIEVSNLTYRVGSTVILDDVSLAFQREEATAILGPNGAGKSSLLKCVVGVNDSSEGQISLDGRPLSDYSLDELARCRAVLSQSSQIAFPFRVHEIVAMGRAPYESDHARDQRIVRETLERVDAWHLKDRVFPTLSGGEQQRVQFARVLAQVWEREGAYLFLDEPTSALDLKHQYELMEIARGLSRARGFGIVMVMHDLNLTRHYADQVIMLNGGRVQETGAGDQVITPQAVEAVYGLSREHAEMHFRK